MLTHGRDTRPCTCSYKTVSLFLVERNHLTIIIVAFILLFDQKVMMFLTEKVFMNANQSMLNWFSTSGLNPPWPGS